MSIFTENDDDTGTPQASPEFLENLRQQLEAAHREISELQTQNRDLNVSLDELDSQHQQNINQLLKVIKFNKLGFFLYFCQISTVTRTKIKH